MEPQQVLEIGRIYFGVAYEDDQRRYPIIHSYEYQGVSNDDPGIHVFRFLGTGDSLELTESNLDLIVSVGKLELMLHEWASDHPALSGRTETDQD